MKTNTIYVEMITTYSLTSFLRLIKKITKNLVVVNQKLELNWIYFVCLGIADF